MVSFRLTVSEYAAMSTLCRAYGYENMSRFALDALRFYNPSILPDTDLRAEAETLQCRVNDLAEDVRRFRERLKESPEGHDAPDV